MKKIQIKEINETEFIVYLLTQDGVKIKAFIEKGLCDTQLRVNKLSSSEDIDSIELI